MHNTECFKTFLARSAGPILSPGLLNHRMKDLIWDRGSWFLLSGLQSCQRHVSSGLGAVLKSETGSLIRADVRFSAAVPLTALSARSEHKSESLGHGSEHPGLAKTCFLKSDGCWEGSQSRRETAWGTGLRLHSNAGGKIKIAPWRKSAI